MTRPTKLGFVEKAVWATLAFAIVMFLLLILGGCSGPRESLRPYVGLEVMDCDALRASMTMIADKIDRRAAANTGADLATAGLTAAVYAGVLPVGWAAAPVVAGEINFPDSAYREALRYRAQVAAVRGCELPESMLEVEE